MKSPDKLRGRSAGKPASEVTKLKKLWRDSLAESARDFWRALFISDTPQPEIRKQLRAKLNINLTRDDQLLAIRQFDLEQQQMDLESERAAEEERRLIEEHPDWTKDQVREDLLRRFYNRARATGDAKLGLKTVAADMKVQSLEFDRERFKESVRTKLEAGLAELAQHIKGNPKAKAAYEAFRSEVKLATK